MPAPSTTLLTGAPRLQFACTACGTILGVPVTMAGVSGPCPSCGEMVAAPRGPRLARRPLSPLSPLSASDRPPEPPPIPSPPPISASEPPIAVPPKRSSLRQPRPSGSPQPETEGRNDPPADHARAETARKSDPGDSEDPKQFEAKKSRELTWAAVGAVIGGGIVLAGMSALNLRRDLSPASVSSAAPAPAPAIREDDALSALAEHKRESARDLHSLLQAQEVVWRLFAASTAEEAQPWITSSSAHPLPPDGLHSPLASVSLRSKHRPAEESGLASSWIVATSRYGELVVEVTESSGKPRVNWDKLSPQLGASAPASDQRTAATP